MSDVYDFSGRRRRDDQRITEASHWVARLEREPTDAELDALIDWIETDPRNEACLLRMLRLWDRMDALARLSALFPYEISRNSA